jgi:hypothetical protein
VTVYMMAVWQASWTACPKLWFKRPVFNNMHCKNRGDVR